MPYAVQTPHDYVSEWVVDLLAAGSGALAVVSDSRGTLTYDGVTNGSFYYGLADRLPRVYGVQHSPSNIATIDRDGYDLKLDNNPTLTASGKVSHQTLADPGNEDAAYTGSLAGGMPMAAEALTFTGDVGVTDNFHTWELFDSPGLPGGNWWASRADLEAVVPYLWEPGQTPAGRALRLTTRRGGNQSQVDYNFATDAVASNTGGVSAGIIVPASVGAGSGLKAMRQQLDVDTDPGAKLQFFGAGGGTPLDETGTQLVVGMPMFRAPGLTGLDLWDLGFSGWGAEEHKLSGPGGALNRHYTDAAFRALCEIAAALGRPVTLIVTHLGANSGRPEPHLTDLVAAVDRLAGIALESTPEVGWLNVTEPEIDASESYRDVDAGIVALARGAGTARVPADRIGNVSIASLYGYESFAVAHPEYTTDGVHANTLGGLAEAQRVADVAAMTPTRVGRRRGGAFLTTEPRRRTGVRL